MSIHEDEHLKKMSLTALAKRSRSEINAARRGETHNDQYWVELLRRATAQRDDAARQVMWHHLGQVIRAWIGCHPRREIACRLAREEFYVAQTCERFWQAITQKELANVRLSTSLQYVHACLNGVILDTMRGSDVPGEPGEKSDKDSRASWEDICELLANEREQRVAYLLFYCDLRPRDIVGLYPQEFNDLQEISRVRQAVIERLLADKITPA